MANYCWPEWERAEKLKAAAESKTFPSSSHEHPMDENDCVSAFDL